MKQTLLTDFLKKFQSIAPPKKVLLKGSGTAGLLVEQMDDTRINLLVNENGRQKFIAVLNLEEYKSLVAIPIAKLCPEALNIILPNIAEDNILLLNEAMIKFWRERDKEELE